MGTFIFRWASSDGQMGVKRRSDGRQATVRWASSDGQMGLKRRSDETPTCMSMIAEVSDEPAPAIRLPAGKGGGPENNAA
jgi:hypothetical protein